MPRTRGLAHVNLHVGDLDYSIRFYVGVFGLELLSEGKELVERAGQVVEMRQALLSTPGCDDLLALTYAPLLPIGNAGINHIGFTFESDDDVRTAVGNVRRYGGRIIREGEREEAGIQEAFAYVQDPDGYKIELYTRGFRAGKEALRLQAE